MQVYLTTVTETSLSLFLSLSLSLFLSLQASSCLTYKKSLSIHCYADDVPSNIPMHTDGPVCSRHNAYSPTSVDMRRAKICTFVTRGRVRNTRPAEQSCRCLLSLYRCRHRDRCHDGTAVMGLFHQQPDRCSSSRWVRQGDACICKGSRGISFSNKPTGTIIDEAAECV